MEMKNTSNVQKMLQRIFFILILFYIFSCSTGPTSSNDNVMPSADFMISPDSGDTETIFVFDASVSTDDKDSVSALQFRWDWENDGTWDTGYLNRTNVIHKFTQAGVYLIALEVKDSDGLTNKITKSLTITEFQPDDYLPLNIGNIWIYSFSSNSRDDIDQNSSDSHGMSSLKLLSVEQGENEIIYYLKFEKLGSRIDRDFNIQTGETTYDTTLISVNDTLVFSEDSTGMVKKIGTTPFFSFELPRYTIDQPDTIEFYNSFRTYRMSKNIGIVYYYYDYYHNWFGYTEKWILTDYQIN